MMAKMTEQVVNNPSEQQSVQRTVQIVLYGLGGVGRKFVRALLDARAAHAEQWGLRLEIVALADSSAVLGNATENLSDVVVEEALAAKEQKKPLAARAGALHENDPKKVLYALSDRLQPGAIIVDTTATDATIPALLDALAQGFSVVLANKRPLATDQEVYDRLTRAGATRSHVRWETTCGAGLPVIVTQQRLLASGDSIERIAGALSGTLGYVMTGLQQGRLFSDVVREAHRLGYTEPDPRDDLGGVDVARKTLILARGLGWRMELVDVGIESLFPLHMASLSIAEFLQALPQLDAHFARRVETARAKGSVLRYAAVIANERCTVGPLVVDASSPLGMLAGSDNLIEFHTRWYSPTPLVIQGRGAGAEATAAGVLADVVDLALKA